MTTLKKRSHLIPFVAIVAIVCTTPALAFAATQGEHGFPWGHFIASWVNFAIFAGILFYFARAPIQEFFAKRKALLEASLLEAQRLQEEAQAKLDEYQARLDNLERERDTLLEEYNQQGARERDRIVEEAKVQIAKMRVDAERVIEQEVKKSIASLEARAVDHAMEMAQRMAIQKLESTPAQNRLVDQYIVDLGQVDVQGHA